MTDVNTAIGLSPGRISHKFLSQQEKVKLKKKEKSPSIQFKKKTSAAERKQKEFR